MCAIRSDGQLARAVEVDGLGQQDAGPGERHVAGVIIETERIFHSTQAYAQLAVLLVGKRVINKPIIQPDIARAAFPAVRESPCTENWRLLRGRMDAFNPISLKSKLPLAGRTVSKNVIVVRAFQPSLARETVYLQVVRQFWHLGHLGQPYF